LFKELLILFKICSQRPQSQTFIAILKLKSITIWMLNIMVKLELEHHPKHSVLFLILDHQTFGFLQKNANFHQLAIFTDISTVQNLQLMLPMELNSISLMVQVLLLVLSVKILLMLLGLKLKKLCSVKSLDSKVNII
jgi:hypothetical protein